MGIFNKLLELWGFLMRGGIEEEADDGDGKESGNDEDDAQCRNLA
jgi:hypothetical protein